MVKTINNRTKAPENMTEKGEKLKIQSILIMDNADIRTVTLNLLEESGRSTGKLKAFLQESDYFTAPASRKYHMSVEGGLARHSLHVYSILYDLARLFYGSFPGEDGIFESLALIAICHDLCKVNFYKQSEEKATPPQQNFARDLFKGRKLNPAYQTNKAFCSDLIGWAKGGFEGPEPVPGIQWEIEDQFPLGHGTKSALVASRYVELTDDELLAIKWHSGPYECSEMERKSFEEAKQRTPLVPLLYAADYLACFVVEGFLYEAM